MMGYLLTCISLRADGLKGIFLYACWTSVYLREMSIQTLWVVLVAQSCSTLQPHRL